MSEDEPELVKISELSRRSGVPQSTIKHYIREGLIPRGSVKTSRNMAWYDVRLVPRIQMIKSIQKTRFLPLKLIKQVLDEAGERVDPAADGVARAIDNLASTEVRTREELLATGVSAEELDWLRGVGVIQPIEGDGERYSGDDLALVELLVSARNQGLDPNMIPAQVLPGYAKALQDLVRFEWQVFQEGLAAMPAEDVTRLAEVATALSERLVILMRRKMLLPTLREMAQSLSEEKS